MTSTLYMFSTESTWKKKGKGKLPNVSYRLLHQHPKCKKKNENTCTVIISIFGLDSQ